MLASGVFGHIGHTCLGWSSTPARGRRQGDGNSSRGIRYVLKPSREGAASFRNRYYLRHIMQQLAAAGRQRAVARISAGIERRFAPIIDHGTARTAQDLARP